MKKSSVNSDLNVTLKRSQKKAFAKSFIKISWKLKRRQPNVLIGLFVHFPFPNFFGGKNLHQSGHFDTLPSSLSLGRCSCFPTSCQTGLKNSQKSDQNKASFQILQILYITLHFEPKNKKMSKISGFQQLTFHFFCSKLVVRFHSFTKSTPRCIKHNKYSPAFIFK